MHADTLETNKRSGQMCMHINRDGSQHDLNNYERWQVLAGVYQRHTAIFTPHPVKLDTCFSRLWLQVARIRLPQTCGTLSYCCTNVVLS